MRSGEECRRRPSNSFPTAAARHGSGAGSAVAGPFAPRESYTFYVPALPGHDKATVQFDVIAFGDWTTSAQNNTVSVEIDGKNAWAGAVATGTPSSTGTTSTGQAYAVYPVSVTVPHSAQQLDVQVSTNPPVGSSQAFGIDNVKASLGLVAAQSFNVTLPATISDGVPAAGAGNLETTASEDDYAFTRPAAGGVQLNFSNCSSSLNWVDWALIDTSSGATIQSGTACWSVLVPNVPAGSYKLAVTRNGYVGTYELAISLQPTPQVFNVSLPASVSDGSPDAGAGNLETTSSQDDYMFTTTTTSGVQLDFANCSTSLADWVDWSLIDTSSGATIDSSSTCWSALVRNVPAGRYELAVTRNGRVGTYQLAISSQPPPQAFDVSLPASISDGVPAAGAGNLETTSSEDDYVFTTTTTTGLQLDFSNCSASLSDVNWALIDTSSNTTIRSGDFCGSFLIPAVAAGQYKLALTRNGRSGTYRLVISSQPPPQVFSVALPVAISDGVPAAGAGNLETTSSEDDYAFSTAITSGIALDFADCSESLVSVNWKLIDSTGATFRSGSGCSTQLLSNVPAGQYHLVVTHNGARGTYSLAIGLDAPDVFGVSLPASISDGVPAAGAGNLETDWSEDDYLFSTSTAGGVQLDFSNCSTSLVDVNWALVDTSSGATVESGYGCSSTLVENVPAGDYKLAVTPTGSRGMYSLAISVQPPPQSFNVSLPASISDGVPAAGARNLEATSSEDDYVFSTTTPGGVQLDFSNCASSLGAVYWILTDTTTGATVGSGSGCDTQTVSSVPASQYKLAVTQNGATGTYQLAISAIPPPACGAPPSTPPPNYAYYTPDGNYTPESCWTGVIVGADGWDANWNPTGNTYVAWYQASNYASYDAQAAGTDQYTVWAIPDGTVWINESNPNTDDTSGSSAQGKILGCVLALNNIGNSLGDVQAMENQGCGS